MEGLTVLQLQLLSYDLGDGNLTLLVHPNEERGWTFLSTFEVLVLKHPYTAMPLEERITHWLEKP